MVTKKGDDEKHLPVVDEPAQGLCEEYLKCVRKELAPVTYPTNYYYEKISKPNPRRTSHLFSADAIRQLVNNPTYLGHLVQMKTTTVSYKNHKTVKKDPSEWVVVYNTWNTYCHLYPREEERAVEVLNKIGIGIAENTEIDAPKPT